MASLFPDDAARTSKPASGARTALRKYPARPKAQATEPAPLLPGWVLAHCDGGARGNPGPSGFGAVMVDAAGSPLAELSEFLGFRTNNFAEYSGLLAVLAWSLETGHTSLRVISDSELMVKQIQGKYKVNSPDLRPLFEEARRRIARLEGFEIFHALRNKNKVADQLANDAMDRGMGKPASRSTVTTATPYPQPSATPPAPSKMDPGPSASASKDLLRGFVRDGVVHLLGGKTLPENSFVKIVPE